LKLLVQLIPTGRALVLLDPAVATFPFGNHKRISKVVGMIRYAKAAIIVKVHGTDFTGPGIYRRFTGFRWQLIEQFKQTVLPSI